MSEWFSLSRSVESLVMMMRVGCLDEHECAVENNNSACLMQPSPKLEALCWLEIFGGDWSQW